MSCIITHSYIIYNPKNNLREPRSRYIEYNNDLFAMCKQQLNTSSMHLGSRYSYTELGDLLLPKLNTDNILADVDVLFLTWWTPEFDPDHASCGTYFCYKYKINSQIFDVCEAGTIAPFLAIQIIQRLFGNINKVLLLGMEQTTIPYAKDAKPIFPTDTGVGGLILEKYIKNSSKPYMEIIWSSSFTSLNAIAVELKKSLAYKNNQQLYVYTKNDIYHQIDFGVEFQIAKIVQYKGIGIIHLFFQLQNIVNQLNNSSPFNRGDYVLFIEDDISYPQLGALLIEIK